MSKGGAKKNAIDYKLKYEDLPKPKAMLGVGGNIVRTVANRAHTGLSVAGTRLMGLARYRLVRRIDELEGKLDMPFIYDSELLNRIEALEERLPKRKKK